MSAAMPDTLSSPYNAICLVTVSIGGVGWQGSGVLLSPDEVLTAAHVVWSAGVGTAVNVQVSPGFNNGTAPFGAFGGNVTHYSPINDPGDTIALSQSGSDYAIIHLNQPVPASVGTFSLGADYIGGTATVSGYPGYSGNQVDNVEAVAPVAYYNLLTGKSIGAGSSGGPIWVTSGGVLTVLGLVSSENTLTGTGYFDKISSAERSQIQAWVAQDEASVGVTPSALYTDTSTGGQGGAAMTATGAGAPSYLQWQYIWSSGDGVAMSASAPNVFLHGGSGQDALQVTSGQNVLDGGTGSNFLTGGTGTDTFFTDARDSAVVWNTLRNFHVGDAATLWGFVQGVSSYHWDAAVGGAAGSTGATLRANIVGGTGRAGDGIDASITFTGLSVAQAQSLQITTGTQPAGSYLYLYNPGV